MGGPMTRFTRLGAMAFALCAFAVAFAPAGTAETVDDPLAGRDRPR